MSTSSKYFLLLSWNVRGLGDPEKCTIIRDAICSTSPSIVCLRETKLNACDFFKAATFLPQNFTSSFVTCNAAGSRGGILTAWDPNALTLDHHAVHNSFCLSTSFTSAFSEHNFSVMNVYAPSDHRYSYLFLSSLSDFAPSFHGPWALAGDFNLIRSRQDKNTAISNSALVSAFNDKINEIGLLEIPLSGSRYTWTNKRDVPTLARLDSLSQQCFRLCLSLCQPSWSS
jgi:exonuclease III